MSLSVVVLTWYLFAGSEPHSGVSERVVREHYVVRGNTEAAVRADIDSKRPGGWDAYTRWDVSWQFWYQNRDGMCSIARVETKLKIVYMMPQLFTEDANLRSSFARYLEKLQTHEDGHAENGRYAAVRIQAALPSMTAGTCDELGRVANAAAMEFVVKANKMDKYYDAHTEHGGTQGARWPHSPGRKDNRG